MGAATSLHSLCGVGGGGGIWEHSLARQQAQLLLAAAAEPQNGAERGLSLLRPGRQPPAPPATLLAAAGRDRLSVLPLQ